MQRIDFTSFLLKLNCLQYFSLKPYSVDFLFQTKCKKKEEKCRPKIPYYVPRELYLENKRRFVLKGSQFEPVRVQSAIVRGSQEGTFPLRPHTVIGNRVTEESEIQNGTTEDVQKGT